MLGCAAGLVALGPCRSCAQQPLLRETAGWFGPWYRLLTHSPHRGWGPYDLRPWMASPAVDLNGDTVADLVLAHRHQACLLAISGVDGKLLWVAARGHDLAPPISTPQARAEQGVVSGVVAEPTAAGDLDADGVTDYVVAWVDERSGGNSVRGGWRPFPGRPAKRAGSASWRSTGLRRSQEDRFRALSLVSEQWRGQLVDRR